MLSAQRITSQVIWDCYDQSDPWGRVLAMRNMPRAPAFTVDLTIYSQSFSLSSSKEICFPWDSSVKLLELKSEMETPLSFRQDWAQETVSFLLASQADKVGSRPLEKASNNVDSRSWQICAPLTLLLGNKSTGLNFCSLKWPKECIQGRVLAVQLR